MNERQSAEAEARYAGGDPQTPGVNPPPSVTKSGIVRVSRGDRPSWERVDAYLREGKHRDQVEAYARRDPAFADVLRWMRNEVEEAEPSSLG